MESSEEIQNNSYYNNDFIIINNNIDNNKIEDKNQYNFIISEKYSNNIIMN